MYFYYLKISGKWEENFMNVYLYVLNTMADWKIGFLMAELHSKRYFKNGASGYRVGSLGIF